MFTTSNMWPIFWASSMETLYMVSLATVFTALVGIPLGVVLVVTRPGHVMESKWFNRILGWAVNFVRSIPFPIFIVFVIPVTRAIVGSSIGPTAVVVPLALAAIALMARLAETALLEVPAGVIEAAQACGSSKWQLVRHVLLPEALPGLLMSVIILIITLIGYSAMAGAVGGGGLGDLAIRYGYQRYQTDVMWICVILLAMVVQLVQFSGETWVHKISHR